MFHSPEHALAVAFAILELPIEPKNATQLIIEALRERYGMQEYRLPSGLTPHDWHAQAVMVISFTRRTLVYRPDLWRAVLAEYSSGSEGALAIQAISNEMMPGLGSEERLLVDLLVMRQFRRRPALRRIADQFDVPVQTLARRERWWRDRLGEVRAQAINALHAPMEASGLIIGACAPNNT